MKKLIFIILASGLVSAHTANGQARRSNTTTPTQRSGGSDMNSYRSNSASSLAPNGLQQRQPTNTTLPQTSDWKTMSLNEKRDVVSNMSPKERSGFLQQMKENVVMDNLDIPSEKQEVFKNLYSEYQASQRQIKEKFIMDKNLDNLSDEEATRRLNQSFEVGQQLLNNRKNYSEKFLKILSPQQVLKLFQTEGKVREKLLDKKNNRE